MLIDLVRYFGASGDDFPIHPTTRPQRDSRAAEGDRAWDISAGLLNRAVTDLVGSRASRAVRRALRGHDPDWADPDDVCACRQPRRPRQRHPQCPDGLPTDGRARGRQGHRRDRRAHVGDKRGLTAAGDARVPSTAHGRSDLGELREHAERVAAPRDQHDGARTGLDQ